MTDELLSPPSESHASLLHEVATGPATSTKPLVAVVFTHNDEATLERCLASIQLCVQAIWVLDAGSTDNTLTIARQYTEHVYYLPEGDSWHMWQVAKAALNAEYPRDAWVLWLEPVDWLPVESQQQLERWHRLEAPTATGGFLLKQVLHHWDGQPLYWGGLVHLDCRLAQLSTLRPEDSSLFCGWVMDSVAPLLGVIVYHQPYDSFNTLLQGALHWGQRTQVKQLSEGKLGSNPNGMAGFMFKLMWVWGRYLGCFDGVAGFLWSVPRVLLKN
ncbi:MAG: glycosyltransferase [Vampirovibrionales bacterium]|nr:glycosyltransferase [Vampirovibrionales bacterium]